MVVDATLGVALVMRRPVSRRVAHCWGPPEGGSEEELLAAAAAAAVPQQQHSAGKVPEGSLEAPVE